MGSFLSVETHSIDDLNYFEKKKRSGYIVFYFRIAPPSSVKFRIAPPKASEVILISEGHHTLVITYVLFQNRVGSGAFKFPFFQNRIEFRISHSLSFRIVSPSVNSYPQSPTVIF